MNVSPLRPLPSSPVTYPPVLRGVSNTLESHMRPQGDRCEIMRMVDGGCRVSLDRESTHPGVLLLVYVETTGLRVRVEVDGQHAGDMSPPRGLPWSRLVPLMLGMAGWDRRPPN